MSTLLARLNANVVAVFTGAVTPGETVFRLRAADQPAVELSQGTGASQADLIYSAERTIAASGSENLDLSGTTLLDPAGTALAFVKVKAILIRAAAANTNNVVVGNHATAAFQGPFDALTDTISIPPGGFFMVTAPVSGWAVTATTADLLKIANSSSGTSVTYDIVIIGTSA
jgi:hypothetical protein